MLTIAAGLLLGLVIGIRHAFEPDHLAAVSTLVSDARGGKSAALLGVWWGIGHTCSLAAVGALVIALGAAIPERATTAFELVVSLMLIALGVRGLVRAARLGVSGHVRAHEHRGRPHVHPTAAAHLHVLGTAMAWRPLLVGLTHGLAGSGALCALVIARLPNAASQLGYIAVFGVGSIMGMAIMTGLAGVMLARIAAGSRVRTGFAVGAASLSIVTGIAWAVPLLA